MANKKQTDSFNKIQGELNKINTKLVGINLKLGVRAKQLSSHWYEYTIYSVQNNKVGNVVENVVYKGKPEAVLGYIKGLSDAMYIFS